MIGFDRIYGANDAYAPPYMTRIWVGRLRLHIFHRGDADPDCHDHPWDFWTFPLTSYVEEVVTLGLDDRPYDPYEPRAFTGKLQHQVVRAFRLHFRPAEHTHRVIGRFRGRQDGSSEPVAGAGNIVTIVWQGSKRRRWGFLRNRDGQWCWTPWKRYVFEGGKQAPCAPSDSAAELAALRSALERQIAHDDKRDASRLALSGKRLSMRGRRGR